MLPWALAVFILDGHSALSAVTGGIESREEISYIRAIITLVCLLARSLAAYRGEQIVELWVACISYLQLRGFIQTSIVSIVSVCMLNALRSILCSTQTRIIRGMAEWFPSLSLSLSFPLSPLPSLHYICIRERLPSPSLPPSARRSSRNVYPVANLIFPPEYAKCAHDLLRKESRGIFVQFLFLSHAA